MSDVDASVFSGSSMITIHQLTNRADAGKVSIFFDGCLSAPVKVLVIVHTSFKRSFCIHHSAIDKAMRLIFRCLHTFNSEKVGAHRRATLRFNRFRSDSNGEFINMTLGFERQGSPFMRVPRVSVPFLMYPLTDFRKMLRTLTALDQSR